MSLSLLDTCVVSPFISSRKAARAPLLVRRVEELLKQGACLSAVTLYEMRRGLPGVADGGEGRRKRARLELFLRSVQVLGLDAQGWLGWQVAAEVYARAKTHVPSLVFTEGDLLIAATAFAHGCTLMTTDVGLGEGMKKLGYPVELWPVE